MEKQASEQVKTPKNNYRNTRPYRGHNSSISGSEGRKPYPRDSKKPYFDKKNPNVEQGVQQPAGAPAKDGENDKNYKKRFIFREEYETEDLLKEISELEALPIAEMEKKLHQFTGAEKSMKKPFDKTKLNEFINQDFEKIDGLQNQMVNFEKKRDDKVKEAASREMERGAIYAEVNQLNDQIRQKQKELDRVQSGISQLKEESEAISTEIRDTTKSLGKFNTPEKINERVRELEVKLQTETLDKKQENQVIGSMSVLKRNRPMVEKLKELHVAGEKKFAEIDEIKKKVEALKEERNMLFDQRQKQYDDINRIQRKVEELCKDIDSFKITKKQLIDQVKDMFDKIKEKKVKNSQQDKDHYILTRKIEALDKIIKKHNYEESKKKREEEWKKIQADRKKKDEDWQKIQADRKKEYEDRQQAKKEYEKQQKMSKYDEQIELCESLLITIEKISKNNKKPQPKVQPQETTAVAPAENKKKTPTKLPIEIFGALTSLEINTPLFYEDIPSTIADLKSKLQEYKSYNPIAEEEAKIAAKKAAEDAAAAKKPEEVPPKPKEEEPKKPEEEKKEN